MAPTKEADPAKKEDPGDNPLGVSHIVKYEDIKLTCDICGNQFSRKGNLDMHRKSVHQGQPRPRPMLSRSA